jgi:hypothetical protein
MTKTELKSKTVAELRELAKSSGLRGYSSLKKLELIEKLAARQATGASAKKPTGAKTKAAPKPTPMRAKAPSVRKAPARSEAAPSRKAEPARAKAAPAKAEAAPARKAAPATAKAAPAKAKATSELKAGRGDRMRERAAVITDIEHTSGRGLSPRTRRAFSVYRSTGEERVHASKYYLGARGSADIDEDFVYPETYGENVIALMVRDPYWLFTYWEFSQDLESELVGRIGEEALRSSKLVLRVYDVTGRDIDDANAHHDIDIAPSARDWYVNVTHVGCDYCVDIGLVLPDGSFIMIARSNRVSLPPVGPSEEVDEKWVTLETLDEIYHLTDRGPTSGSGGWGSGGWGRQ